MAIANKVRVDAVGCRGRGHVGADRTHIPSRGQRTLTCFEENALFTWERTDGCGVAEVETVGRFRSVMFGDIPYGCCELDQWSI